MGSHKIIQGINDLKTWCLNNNSGLLEEWDYEKNKDLSPNSIAYASGIKVWWKCSNGHNYDAKVGNRVFLNRGCPYCSGNKILSGYNDFRTWCILHERTDLLEEWNYEKNGIAPSQISPQNNKKVWWKCSLGHEWDSTVGSRT